MAEGVRGPFEDDDTAIEDMRKPVVFPGFFGWPFGPRINLLRSRQSGDTAAAPAEHPATEEDVHLDDLGGPRDECGFELMPEDVP